MIILNSGVGNCIQMNGKTFSYFGGNNYLGLAGHPAVKEAAIQAITKYGVNFSASRHTTGTADLHLALEKQLSLFKGTEDAIVFASGYLGNSILLESLKSRYSALFIDISAHPSITGAIPANIENIYYYRHCDPDHLNKLLNRHKGCRPLIITDGVFALTGEIAPLDRIYHVALEHKALIIVDDSHSTGVLGKTGKGTPEHFNLHGKNIIYQTETMSKALGGYGGFLSGSGKLISSIREKSKTYQSSTALPPPIVAAVIASLKILEEHPDLHVKLLEKAGKIRNEISSLGFHTTPDPTPIIPIILGSSVKARDLSGFLERDGIIVPVMNYPVKQEKFSLRIAVSVTHTHEQIKRLIEKLSEWRDKNGTE
jgi:7-keto-8-aminopelargonate synthetase-like enzyme